MLYPKIGIRPVIDGRWGGVRESLENQTMRMAENAAKLISENLKYPDGTPVQCVIGCTTIGGGAEAARVAEQFSTQNVTATLSVTPCWCYGTETFDMDPNTIKAVWGFNGTERPGAVYLAAVLAAHAQRGLPAFSIYGHDVQEANDDTIPDDVAEKILRFARGAVAAGWMKNKAYVNIGAVTMGIAGSFCDAGSYRGSYQSPLCNSRAPMPAPFHIRRGHRYRWKCGAGSRPRPPTRRGCRNTFAEHLHRRTCRLSSRSRKLFRPTRIGSLSSR